MKNKNTYTHAAQVEEVVNYLALIDYHKTTLKINIDAELKPIFESDRENFPLVVRDALFALLREHLKTQPIEESIEEFEINKNVWQIVDTYHIVLETTQIKKIQNVILEIIPQTCDVIILGKGPREAYIRKAAFACEKGCIEFIKVFSDKAIPIIDDNCIPHKKPLVFSEVKSHYDFIQRIVIQEQLVDAKNASPLDYDGRITGDMLNETFVGQKKRVMIVPRILSGKKGATESKILFDIISVADLEEEKKILPSNKEVEEYRKSAEIEGYFDKVIESFAPNVIGDEIKWVKKALMLALIGANKIEDSRGDINVLLLGDPSVAKSSMLKYCQSVVQKGIYTSGKGASAAGLTIGMVKRSDGTMMAQPGILPLCHNGVALIDEFDKMDDKDRSGMHEAMEQQSVSIAKAGTSLTLPAQATVIAAANPKYGKWKMEMPIMENANLPPALMSRFDIKFRILDIPNEIMDQKKAAHVMSKFREEKVTLFSRLQILAIINYAKTLRPRLSDEAGLELQKFYTRLRGKDTKDISIDIRQLESLIRLSIAHAKLHFKDFVDIKDVHAIIQIYKASLQSFDIDIEVDSTQVKFFDSRELNQNETFWKCFEESKGDDGSVDMVDVIAKLASTKLFDEYKAKSYFEKMISGRKLYELRSGRWKRVD
jgi:DNA replicative helicase MCM subunit Mcm2 (Cdc46/Mcm family)